MRLCKIILLCMAVLLITAGIAAFAFPQEKKEEKDPVLKMSQVPQKVQQTIKTYASTAEIKQITMGDVDGTKAYEFQIEKGGRKSEVSITPDGKVLTTEEDIPLSEFPDAARQAVNAKAAGGKIVSTEKVFENGKTAFEAVIEKGGKQSTIAVSADGKIVGSEEEIPLSEVPDAARKTINAKAAGAKVVSTRKDFENEKTAFEAVIEKGGKQSTIAVSADGKIVSSEEEIPLSEVPEAARKTIDAKAAGGKILSTKKVLENGKTVFAVVIEKGGKQVEITVAQDGKLVDSEDIKH